MPKRVLILCTGNSTRSQMAEAWWRELGGDGWEVFSAGSEPAGQVSRLATQVMQEAGLDLDSHSSKHLDQFRNQPLDLVVTVCDSARDSCPVWPHAGDVLHWPFPDPTKVEGSDEERIAAARGVRDDIRQRIKTYLETGT